MLNPERLSCYLIQGGHGTLQLGGVTPAQARRMKRKQFSRKTHEHIRGQAPACGRCKPGWTPARLRRLERQA